VGNIGLVESRHSRENGYACCRLHGRTGIVIPAKRGIHGRRCSRLVIPAKRGIHGRRITMLPILGGVTERRTPSTSEHRMVASVARRFIRAASRNARSNADSRYELHAPVHVAGEIRITIRSALRPSHNARSNIRSRRHVNSRDLRIHTRFR
jgi:hypothetical protein